MKVDRRLENLKGLSVDPRILCSIVSSPKGFAVLVERCIKDTNTVLPWKNHVFQFGIVKESFFSFLKIIAFTKSINKTLGCYIFYVGVFPI